MPVSIANFVFQSYQAHLAVSIKRATRSPPNDQLPFEMEIIEHCRRRESSVEEVMIELYLEGVSVHWVEDIFPLRPRCIQDFPCPPITPHHEGRRAKNPDNIGRSRRHTTSTRFVNATPPLSTIFANDTSNFCNCFRYPLPKSREGPGGNPQGGPCSAWRFQSRQGSVARRPSTTRSRIRKRQLHPTPQAAQ